MLKRWISAFMAAALCLTMLPVGIMAEDPVAGALEPAVADGATWPVDVPTVAFFSTETPSEETWLGKKDAFKGELEDEATAWLIWDTTKHTADDKADFAMLLDNNDTGKTEIVNGIWEDSFDTKLRRLGIELDPNFEQGYVKVSIEYEYSYDLRITLDGVEAWLNIDPDTSATGKDDEDDEQASTVLPTLSYHDEPVRSLDTWLKGEADDILYGNNGTPDVAYLMWDTDVVGTVSSVYVDFEDVYGNGFVLGNADMTDTQAINVLSVYNIKLTADWTNHYIQVDTDFNQAYNLYLTLVNTNGERFSCHLNIDEYDITAGDKDEESDLPVVAFYDEKEPSEDSLIKRELLNGPAGETRSAWLIWDSDMFSVDEKAEIEVYMEKNEVDGIELPSTVWDDSVDSLLSNYGISLLFVPDKSFVKVTATFVEDQTVDFALTLTDNDGDEHEVQLNIDVENDSGDDDIGTETRGLKWCWLDEDDEPELHALRSEMNFALQNTQYLAIVFDGEVVDFDDLTFPNFVVAEEANGYVHMEYVRVDGLTLPYSGVITYDAGKNKTYSMPITVDLPIIAFYDSAERNEMSLLGYQLEYTGTENDQSGNDCSHFYLLLEDGWTVKAINADNSDDDISFLDWDYVTTDDGKQVALVSICEGFEDKWYSLEVTAENAEGISDIFYTGFEIIDARPGLRFKYVDNDDNDQYFTEEELYRELNSELDNGHWIAVYYVDGENETPIPLSDLKIPGVAEARLLDDNNPYFIQLRMIKLGEGAISCKAYPGCSIPVSVELPDIAFYNKNERSGDTYLGDVLPYTGEGSKIYVLPSEDFTITKIVLDPKNEGYDMDFFDYDITDDGSYAEVTLSEDFDDERYRIRVYVDHINGWGDFWDLRFEVEDCSPGLRFKYVDNDDNDQYFTQDGLNRDLNGTIDDGHWIAVYYVDGDDETPIPLSDLKIPGVAEARLLDDNNPYFIQLRMIKLGEGAISCKAYPGCSIPVSVELPDIAFYNKNERSGDTYLGDVLPYTGEGSKIYVLPSEDFTITKIVLDPRNEGYDMDFFDYEIADDGSYAEVTLSEDFNDDRYRIRVYAEHEDGWNNNWDLRFEVEDCSPGLRFKYVDNDDNDQYFTQDGLNRDLNGTIDDGHWIAVYYVDGDDETPIPLSDLKIPGVAEARLLDDNNPYFFQLNMIKLGEGVITCDDYPSYSIPVSVNLPEVAFYGENERSGDTYLGDVLPYTGEDSKVYILPSEDFTITKIVLDPRNEGYDMDFFDYEIADDGSYAEVTLSEDFNDDRYRIRVYVDHINGWDDNWDLRFEVEDCSPGLRFKYVDNDDNDQYFTQDGLYRDLNRTLDDGHWIAVYYVDGDDETPIPLSDLNIPSILETRLLDDGNPYFFQLNMIKLGEGVITCDDYPSYSIPVSVNLPEVSFYSENERSGDTYLGDVLPYTGEGSKVYILPSENFTITKIVLDPKSEDFDMDFFDFAIADDGSYAEVTLPKDFDDERYRIRVYVEHINGWDDYWDLRFEVEDCSPGLRWCWLDRDDQPELDELRSSMDFDLGDSPSLSIVYDDKVNIPVVVDFDSLSFPDFIDASEEDDYLYLEFLTVGEGKITSSDYPGCSIPVIVHLPNAGIFKEPEMSIEGYLGDTLSAMPGETATAYLVWNPDVIKEVDDVLVTFEYGQDWETLLDRVSLEDAEDVLEDHGVYLTVYKEDCYIEIEAKMDVIKCLQLYLCDGGGRWGTWLQIDNDIAVKIHNWRGNKENPVITYNGEEYSFGIGRIDRESGKFDMFGAGGGFGSTSGSEDATLDETVYLGAMVAFDTRDEDAAPAWVYDCISDVSFDIVDYINAHDLSDQAEPNVFIDRTYTSTFNGCKMPTVDIDTVPGGFVEALLRVSFTVTMPGEAPVRCSVDNVVHLAYNHTIYPDMSEIDTAAELNEILSGMDAFLTWIKKQDQDNGTDMYEQYMANQALNWEATYELHLPAVTYDDIIEVNLSGVEFEISGTTDPETGKRTTMPGMWLHENNFFFLSRIDFVAVPGITQKYDGEAFTCGVLAMSDEIDDGHGDAYTVHDCTFTGFDYGVRNTPYGYACVGGRNHFNNCDVGYLIDCAGKTGGNANDQTSECIFENCKTAIKILGLPEYITPYDYRIYNCDFINNNKDIESTLDGRLYCYFNYFGHYTRGAKSLADVTELEQIQSRPAGIKEKKNATIITNPRYALPINAWDNWDSNYLTIDNGRHTYIFNSQAGDLLLDAKALTEIVESSEEEITINVMGDDEKVTGTWTFNGKED